MKGLGLGYTIKSTSTKSKDAFKNAHLGLMWTYSLIPLVAANEFDMFLGYKNVKALLSYELPPETWSSV